MTIDRGIEAGISVEEAEKRLVAYGRNELIRGKRFSILALLWSQFTSPLIYILLIAMGVTLILGDTLDAVVIGMAVLVNTLLGFYQEYKAERSLEALASMLSPQAIVFRDGERFEVPVKELVPGDVVVLEAGEKIPADGITLRASELKVNEAVLTGESVPVYKSALSKRKLEELVHTTDRVEMLDDWFVGVGEGEADNSSSLYMGTHVLAGSATMKVVRTGSKTQVGKIAENLAMTEEELTPLQRTLRHFSNRLAMVVLGLAGLIVLVGVWEGDGWLEMFTLGVAVAVSAIPEGLVVSLTAILAIGMQRILTRGSLVRKLVAAEVLGSVSVICSDKTGTLTKGEMSVLEGDFVDEQLGLVACLATADLKDPMEVALWEWVSKRLGKAEAEKVLEDYKRVDRKPFSSETKFSATLTEQELFVVGAPETLMARSRMSQKERNEWEEKIDAYTSKGLRVIGVAHRRQRGGKRITKDLLSQPWYWLGLVVYEDTLRRGLVEHIGRVKRAGIGLKVITGDYKKTAMYIMKKLGISLNESQVMEGAELQGISLEELDQRIGGIQLFARTSPTQKLKIVESLRRKGEVVAMTGDGVNDAPALKRADIGIVVSSASDVSKETADIVLLDDDFGTIIAAVEEGRGIFENLRKVLLYLLSDSFSEVILVVGSLLIGLPLPVTAAQILWVNLANDGLPNLALTIDPKEEGLLKRKPRSPNEPVVNREIGVLIGLISTVTGLMTLGSFWGYWTITGDLALARTMAFTILSVDSLLYVFSSRSLHQPIWRNVPWKNPWLLGAVGIGFGIQLLAIYLPWLQGLLKTVPLGLDDWMVVMVVSLTVIGVIEVAKAVFAHHRIIGEGKIRVE